MVVANFYGKTSHSVANEQDPDGEIENSGKSLEKAGYQISVLFKL